MRRQSIASLLFGPQCQSSSVSSVVPPKPPRGLMAGPSISTYSSSTEGRYLTCKKLLSQETRHSFTDLIWPWVWRTRSFGPSTGWLWTLHLSTFQTLLVRFCAYHRLSYASFSLARDLIVALRLSSTSVCRRTEASCLGNFLRTQCLKQNGPPHQPIKLLSSSQVLLSKL